MSPKTIGYENIVEIRRMRFVSGILIITDTGKTLRLISGIHHVGECIEEIRYRAINLKKVDFGKLDKVANFWNFESDWPAKFGNDDVEVKISKAIMYILGVYGGAALLIMMIIKYVE